MACVPFYHFSHTAFCWLNKSILTQFWTHCISTYKLGVNLLESNALCNRARQIARTVMSVHAMCTQRGCRMNEILCT